MREMFKTSQGVPFSLEDTVDLSDNEVVQNVASQQMEILVSNTRMTPHRTSFE